MLAVISPFMVPLAGAVIGLDYLRRLLQPPAASTSPVAEPFTPPFTGGQCEGVAYKIILNYDVWRFGSFLFTVTGNEVTGTGTVSSIGTPYQATATQWRFDYAFTGSAGSSVLVNGSETEIRNWSPIVARVDGLPDNCGDLPNPNPAPPISSDGLASSSPVEPIDDSPLVTGAPLVVVPKLASVLAAIKAAVAGASDALNAIKDVMDAIDAIGNAIDAINDWLKDRDKRDPAKKSLYVFTYGSVRKDGFLRLYPDENNTEFEPVFIDLQLLSIPIGYGKYFGSLSPNFYRFRSLGHISFVSSTLGVIETRPIEFSRMSLNVPDNAYGFFYHLGLDDIIRANVSLFYLQTEEVVEA